MTVLHASPLAGTPVDQHAIDGVLVVNKPTGWTSHDVVAKLRGLLRGHKVGHAGTLDPAATGVLPLLVGRATRIAEYLVEWDKEYRAVLRLGQVTDTQDATGQVLAHRSIEGITAQAVADVVARFRGRIMQLPPMYSAIKVDGVPLYKVARAGRTVAREPREVTIHRLDIVQVDGSDVTLHVVCSKGTYVRTLCADIGEALGVGGHLYALDRRRVGRLTIEEALSIDTIACRAAAGQLSEHLHSLDEVLSDFPALTVNDATAARVLHGVPVPIDPAAGPGAGCVLRIKDGQGRLLAMGRVAAGDRPTVMIEKVLLVPAPGA